MSIFVGMQDWATWAMFGGGAAVSLSGAYVLGRMDSIHRVRKVRDTWVLTEDLGVFGFALLGQFRSRATAEQERRRWSNSGRRFDVMAYSEWLAETTARVHSIKNWERINRIVFQVKKVEATETTILPVIPPPLAHPFQKMDEIATSIEELGIRLNGIDNRMSDAFRLMDQFRAHITHLDQQFTDHTEKIGHVTAELKVISDDEEHGPSTRPLKLSGTAGRPRIRSTRGLVGLDGKLAEHRENRVSESTGARGTSVGSDNKGNKEGV